MTLWSGDLSRPLEMQVLTWYSPSLTLPSRGVKIPHYNLTKMDGVKYVVRSSVAFCFPNFSYFLVYLYQILLGMVQPRQNFLFSGGLPLEVGLQSATFVTI